MIWQAHTVGYTARALDDQLIRPKYHSQYEPNFVFNVNMQSADRKFVVVCEGPFDAMAVDGVAVLGSECSEQQADIIDGLNRRVIVVPDADRAGTKLVDSAIKYSWDVSFPVWQPKCKDINSAVQQYGKLFVLKSILAAAETSRLKIELRKKKLHG
jgi:DNA primase